MPDPADVNCGQTVPTEKSENFGSRTCSEAMGEEQQEDIPDWKKLIRLAKGWRKVANRYIMEWDMVWKDVTIGFTVAGIIAAFVPKSSFKPCLSVPTVPIRLFGKYLYRR